MSYVIEEGIPLPPTRKGGNWTGPKTEVSRLLEIMEVNQSVLIPEHKEYKIADSYSARHRSKRFAFRKIAGQGWRVWRVE